MLVLTVTDLSIAYRLFHSRRDGTVTNGSTGAGGALSDEQQKRGQDRLPILEPLFIVPNATSNPSMFSVVIKFNALLHKV